MQHRVHMLRFFFSFTNVALIVGRKNSTLFRLGFEQINTYFNVTYLTNIYISMYVQR